MGIIEYEDGEGEAGTDIREHEEKQRQPAKKEHKHKIDFYKNKFLLHSLTIQRINFICYCYLDGYSKEEINVILTKLNIASINDADKNDVLITIKNMKARSEK